MIKALLVDDEARSTDLLTNILGKYCPEVEILASAKTIDQAYEEILVHAPNLVFLDVELPPFTGFDLLKKFDKVNFEVVFVTAFDHFAIDAIRFSALDYLVKPVKIDELKNAIKKAKERIEQQPHRDISASSELLQQSEITKLVINSQKGIDILEIKDILYFEAKQSYTEFFTANGQKFLSTKHFSDYDQMFNDKGFFRIHRSYIVNLHHVKSLDKSDGDEIILQNNQRLPLARRRKIEFLQLLK